MDKIEQAKATLREAGYYVGNLWHINDVKNGEELTDKQAQDILHGALENDATIDQIWFAIDFHRKELLQDDTTEV